MKKEREGEEGKGRWRKKGEVKKEREGEEGKGRL